ncbi:MAG: bifunctional homocysteine S-methyltransferase/methylenetetrahydrofolate reductase [Ruminococcaceae bacterium]|nr:bifunctional homocysteine S-methyltransferase/methylenetetrahydrofolate reductase [Oscillospiraceae bacterium]
MKPIREYLQDGPLVFDGAMGTYYAARSRSIHQGCERANRTAPEEIAAIHRAYLAAGCGAIKTNTYAVNRLNFSGAECASLLKAGYELARQTAGENAYVFADIGPIDPQGDMDILAEYLFVVDCFLALGAAHFLLETLGNDRFLPEIARHIKEKQPEAFLLVSFAVQPDGFTRDGRLLRELMQSATAVPEIDAVGLNCLSGGRQMVDLLEKLGPVEKPLSAMPVAGYPTVRANRVFYDSDPRYFAMQAATLRAQGVIILGGCCGTTPEHIAAMVEALRLPAPRRIKRFSHAAAAPVEPRDDSFWTALCDDSRKPFAVELDPPENADVSRFMEHARQLQHCGADVITIADCPVARVRIDSSLLACKLHRELGIDVLPHMTCRDRNLNATQALLLGLCAEGIGSVLLVTGDPVPAASRDEVKNVYHFNSRKLIKYVDGLNQTLLPTPFRLFAALNLNARNFRIQLDLARQKEEVGAVGFLTQPILTEQAFENLQLARETLHGRILGGIMPVISHRNALFMNSEIAGITVDEKVIALYENADRARGEELAVDISAEVAKRIAPYVDGYYLITPFGRTELVARIIERIRQKTVPREL